MTNIQYNIKFLKETIKQLALKYGQAHPIHLLAVSKGQPIEKIKEASKANQFHFGESYCQEALKKILALNDPQLIWHFIGPIQRNKTRKIAEHFTWVHSVDHLEIAKRLHDQRPQNLPPLNVCIQINISYEPTKSGISAEALPNFAKACLTFNRLRLRGLMGIPAPHADLLEARKAFRRIFLLWQDLRNRGFDLDTLSMGMSHDFEAAIAEGSTLLRIGTLIFGERQQSFSTSSKSTLLR